MGRATHPAVIILGGRSTAVPVARSIGASGAPVIALGAPADQVRFSRFCTRFVDVGEGDDVQERILRWLQADAPAGSVVLPCSDDGLEVLARHRSELLQRGLVLPGTDDELTLALLDKARTHDLARALGIATPAVIPIAGPADVARAAAELAFPCAAKPIHSHEYAQHFSGKAVIVGDARELAGVCASAAARGVAMLATEIVPGADDQLAAYCAYVGTDGETLVEFTSRKIRQYPSGFGLGCYVVNGWEPEVAELGRRFVRDAGVRGLSYTEFKRDARTGELRLIECNNRFTIEVRSVPVDVPLLVYNDLLGRLPPSRRRGRAVHLWDPLNDLRTLVARRRAGDLSVPRWLATMRLPLNFHVFRIDDPLPTLAYHAMKVRGRLRGGPPRRSRPATGPVQPVL